MGPLKWDSINSRKLNVFEIYFKGVYCFLCVLCVHSVSKGVAEGRKWFKIAMKEACLVADVYVAAADFEVQLGMAKNLEDSI
jgi:hypothetical protein